MKLTELEAKKAKLIEYINHGHHVEIDKLNTTEGIDILNAKMNYDKETSEINEEFERTLIEIKNAFPSSQDWRRIRKEKIATKMYKDKLEKTQASFNIEKARIHNRIARLMDIEKLELKYANINLSQVNKEISKIKSQNKKTNTM